METGHQAKLIINDEQLYPNLRKEMWNKLVAGVDKAKEGDDRTTKTLFILDEAVDIDDLKIEGGHSVIIINGFINWPNRTIQDDVDTPHIIGSLDGKT